MQPIYQQLLVAWRSGLRSRSFQAIFLLGLLTMGAAYLAAEFSGRQPATVALDIGISAIRIIGLLLVLSWCQELLGKEIDRRTIFVSLTYPAPRSSFVLGRYFGLITLMLLAVIVLGLLLTGTVYLAIGGYAQASPVNLGGRFWLTLGFIALDLAVIASFGVLITAFSTTPLLPMALGVGFAIAARSLGPVIEFLRSGTSSAENLHGTFMPIFDALLWALPDLSRLDVRPLTLYPQLSADLHLLPAAAMAVAYAGVLLCLAVVVFARRQFS